MVDEELVTAPLNRADLLSNKVEVDFIFNLDESEGDDQFINDHEIENDTYIDYCDSKEDLHIEEDMNIVSRSIFFVQSSLAIMVCDIILFIKI